MLKIILQLLLIILIFSCQKQQVPSVVTIKVPEIANDVWMTMSEIVDTAIYIPLETTDECLIDASMFRRMEYYKGKFYCFVFTGGLYIFDRAYAYMNYCLKAALLYSNRVRIINISTELDKIYANYQQRDIRWRNSLQNYLYVVTFFSIILVLALIGLYRQTKKMRKSRTELDSVNHSLNQHVVELSQMHKQLALANQELQNLNELLRSANQKLQESNDVKEEYIGYVFSICSNYISKLDEYRKNINRKLKTGQFEEARQLTDNSSLTQNELKDFYANFDAIFLRVYPDFVADLNSLLRPEEQILLKDASELNTEVRIYALVRLGINDSVKIADFLHCSPQTVYNHRLRMRNKAIIPKDKFAEAVRLLGRGGK